MIDIEKLTTEEKDVVLKMLIESLSNIIGSESLNVIINKKLNK